MVRAWMRSRNDVKTVHVAVPAELRDFQAAPVTGARPSGVARMVTS